MRPLCLVLFFAGLCHSVSWASECTARGRFPNKDAEDCRGYTMCLLGGASGYTQYKLTCPASFAYSHLEHQCTNATNYQCMPTYICNKTGNFENPLSKNCSSYIACPEGILGIVTARQVECPFGDVFSPVEGTCVSTGYTCNVEVTTEAVTVTVTVPNIEVSVTVPSNATFNIQASVENGFQLSSSAIDVCSTHALVALLVLVYVNN